MMDLNSMNSILEASKKHIDPNIRIRYKSDSAFWMRLPEKMQKNWMTFETDVWAPSKKRVSDPVRATSTIAIFLHECRHVADSMASRLKYYAGYLFPQFLGPLLALVAVIVHLVFDMPWHMGWSLGASCLALFPWPSPTRVNIEDHAYAISTWVRFRKYSNFSDPRLFLIAVESLTKALNSWVYYKMIWRKKKAELEARKIVAKAKVWCINETFGYEPKPFENEEFNAEILRLLDKPFTEVWIPK